MTFLDIVGQRQVQRQVFNKVLYALATNHSTMVVASTLGVAL